MDKTFAVIPTQFGAVHLAILAVVVLLSAALALLLRKQPEERLTKLIGILGALMILAEIGKQWFVRRYVYPNGATWFFPWQLCSIAMYASFLVPFLWGKARDALLTFLGSFSLLAAVIALLVPGSATASPIISSWWRRASPPSASCPGGKRGRPFSRR